MISQMYFAFSLWQVKFLAWAARVRERNCSDHVFVLLLWSSSHLLFILNICSWTLWQQKRVMDIPAQSELCGISAFALNFSATIPEMAFISAVKRRTVGHRKHEQLWGLHFSLWSANKGFEFKDLPCLDIAADSQDPGCFAEAEVQKQLLNTKNEKEIKLDAVWVEGR